MNDENVMPKLQLMEERRKVAKGAAKSIVQTPNFNEIRTLWAANKKAMYSRYYDQFSSYPSWNWSRNIGNTPNFGVF